MSIPNAIFMIESGKPLEMVKSYIAERTRVRDEVRTLAEELGVKEVYTDRRTHVLTGVVFPSAPHPDFCKPKKRNGVSFPKKGSEWAKRLNAQQGTPDQAPWIAKEFGIPLSLSYQNSECNGWHGLGSPLAECGFLWMSYDCPYAMWAPDVPAAVADHQAKGYTVGEPATSFQFAIDGVRRIHKEEWEILVLQQKLGEKGGA